MSVEKAKDEVGGLAFAFKLERLVLMTDEDGREISSLIVHAIEEANPVKPKKADGKRKPPPSANLLLACINEALDVNGRDARPFSDGPTVRAVGLEPIRKVYYARLGDKDNSAKRSSFNRGIDRLLDRQDIAAGEIKGERCVWLP